MSQAIKGDAWPRCQKCGAGAVAKTYCCRHRLDLCVECAADHDDHSTCYFRGAVPIRLTASKQLRLAL
jgi:hypothetical protein